MSKSVEQEIKRKVANVDNQPMLFDLEPDWRDHWWGMPDFSMEDAQPNYKVTINFLTEEDLLEFSRVTGIPLTARSDSGWYPNQERIKGGIYRYEGDPVQPRYPICMPSKGRADCQLTGKALERMGVNEYLFFVEETEADEYIKHVGKEHVVVMPFHDLGQGSIPARNFIWEWAKAKGYQRHWTVDDNIRAFRRCHMNRRLNVLGGGFWRAMEDFVDRYENVAMAGPHNQGFVPDRQQMAPFLFNSRVYSCILLDTNLPEEFRWRGRYNEDTDLSLRLLKSGYCTLLFRALIMDKAATVGSKGGKALKGGNTDNVYNTGDHRMAFAKSLEEQHPDVVQTVWKFNRWHHQVDYSPFKRNMPIFRDDLTKVKSSNNYGMKLVKGDESDAA